MTGKEKLRRTALVLMFIIGAVFLWPMFQLVKGFISHLEVGGPGVFDIINYLISLFLTVLSYIVCSNLLFSIRRDETPFMIKNVKKLKILAMLIVAFEVCRLITERVFNRFFSIIIDDNTLIVVESFSGGIVISAGLVIYAVALVFQYGISLQTQVDETL